jgi:hypothetical protein
MHRAGLLAILLLAVAVTAGNATLTCTIESSRTVDTTDAISVSFDFTSLAPVFPDIIPRFITGNLTYSPAISALWDGPLEFKAALEHYAPNQRWRIDEYKCVYNNSGRVEVRYYDVVAQTPQRRTTTITFTVPPTAAEHGASTTVQVSKPPSGSYCSAPPTLDSWPNCPAFKAEDNKVSVEHPEWNALQVNRRRPGDVVSKTVVWNILRQHVNATIPNPWRYGIKADVGTLSYVEIDGNRYDPDVADIPVRSSVYLYMVGMPKRWGTVKVNGTLDVPLYVKTDGGSLIHPNTFCKPPSCFVLAYANRSGSHYYILAIRSGLNLTKTTWIYNRLQEIHLPLGSILQLPVTVKWTLPEGFTLPSVVVVHGTPFFRIINDTTYYEEIAKKGKLKGPRRVGPMSYYIDEWSVDEWAANYYRISYNQTIALVVVAVDESTPLIVFDMYAWPLPLPKFAASGIVPPFIPDRVSVFFPGAPPLGASVWLSEALKRNYPEVSGGRYVDMLRFFYGEPTTYYLGNGDQRGMVFLRTTPRYDNTAADINGTVKLNYTTGIAHTDVAVFHIPFSVLQLVRARPSSPKPSSPQTSWTQPPSPQTSSPTSWLVFLVPTMACRTMFCTSLSPELVGPLPPTTGYRALPNTGYSIMLMYIGSTGRHRVKVYVEDGYVITSRQSINVTRVRNYKLVEIEKEWKPFEAVIVGPGWWVPYRWLGPCDTMPVNASSIYAAPDWTGPVEITVEDNGVNSTYVFYVTNDVGYRITTRTPAPASLTTTPFNVTAYVMLDGLPYYHAVYGYGEGGRLSPPACTSTWYDDTFLMPQLVFSGDFWSAFGLANTPLKPVNIRYNYTKPQLELVEPWRGLVKVKAEGPVAGFAFYAQRGGAWVKIGEVSTKVGNEYRGCLLVNASRVFPWDPILVLPLVEQELEAAPGSTVAIWRPETALLFKAWADVVGYPKGVRSVLEVVGVC